MPSFVGMPTLIGCTNRWVSSVEFSRNIRVLGYLHRVHPLIRSTDGWVSSIELTRAIVCGFAPKSLPIKQKYTCVGWLQRVYPIDLRVSPRGFALQLEVLYLQVNPRGFTQYFICGFAPEGWPSTSFVGLPQRV